MAKRAANEAKLIDIAIVGAGPIGLELAVALKAAGVEYVHFEAQQIGYTISRWPPNTHFFSSPERIAIAGVPIPTVDQEKPTGEAYLAYLRSVVEQFDLKVLTYERVLSAERQQKHFELLTAARGGERRYRCRRLVFATGGMAAPNRLEIPGEGLPHVSHYMADPHRYFRTRLLVIGGMNSALEAALRCFRAGAEVTISYRRAELGRQAAKRHLVSEVNMWIREGRISYFPETTPIQITPDHVLLVSTRDAAPVRVPADFVLVCTGFVADMSLLEQLGVELRGPRQVPVFSPETMETNVPGVYVAGTAAGGTQKAYQLFIETSHVDVEKITAALVGRSK